MDIENSTLQTPESEHVTPIRTQPPQPTNGVLKRRPIIHIHHFRHPVSVTYKECLKNYDAPNGRHIIDGCGEFLPAPTSNLSNPQSLHCDVCGCHRNFHRRDEEYYLTRPFVMHNRDVQIGRQTRDSSDESPPAISSSAQHMLMALSHGPGSGAGAVPVNPNMNNFGVSRKRFRTKFTQDQKGKMLELAKNVGWKIQKKNEVVINESCREIGVEKGVFKVWMHNNKNTIGKKETTNNSIPDVAIPPTIVTSYVGNGVVLNEDNLGNGDGVHVEEKRQEHNVVDDTNDGSSPSPTA